MDSLNKLMEYFAEFPGIGPRQARRFAYFLLGKNPAYTEELSRLINDIRRHVRICGMCFRFYASGADRRNDTPANTPAGTANLCSVCADPHRDRSQLMIVARDVDYESIEKSRTYQGLYFVLGGTVPILEKNPETRIRSRELVKRLEKELAPKDADGSPALKEIILSLNANPEGEHTVDVLRGMIRSLSESIRISILGRGLSTGSELEYSDADTIKNALKNRA